MKIIIVALSIFSFNSYAGEVLSLKAYLKQELAGAAKISKESFNLTNEQKSKLESIAKNAQDTSFTFYYGRDKAEKLNRACTIVLQQGKEGPLSIGTCFDADGLVASVNVLSSEEERGKETSEQSFLKQFKGKKIADAFIVGNDVDGVSGATYSSRSVAEAIRKSVYAFKTFVGVKK